MRILILEDDDGVRRALARAIESDGHEVMVASSLRACRPLFEVGVFDLHLPDGSGRDLAVGLLSAGVIGSAVFFTASTDGAEIGAAKELGRVVRKDVAELRRILQGIDPGGPSEDDTR